MANTRIQIKRSQNTQAPPALWTGELCYSQNGSGTSTSNGGLLYIGRPSDNTAIAVGGVLTMGVLTPNQVISTNSTSYLDRILATNGNFNIINVPTQGNGSPGQILTSNGTSNLYWSSAGGGGSVTQINEGNGISSTQNPLTTSGTLMANIAGTMYFVSGAIADMSTHLLYGGL